ncbi:hypothetical protein AKJ08_3332 [Vulgatibacter incomptus]|uniref:Uncharacterized protein n=1 Tax=Vulgatibacter incomptus TaxID=1391653 RepID=A0A0K1PHE7_9BACT|nr:hypothetical protein AKJ08_3332 [Vulgatibacter incomptus]
MLSALALSILLGSSKSYAAPPEPPAPLVSDQTARNRGAYPRIRSQPDGATDVFFESGGHDMRWDVLHAIEYVTPAGAIPYTKVGNASGDYLVSEQLLYNFVTNTAVPGPSDRMSIHRDVMVWNGGGALAYTNVVTGAGGSVAGWLGRDPYDPSTWEGWVAYTFYNGSWPSIGLHHIPTDTTLPEPYPSGDDRHPNLSMGKLVYESRSWELAWQYMGQPWTEKQVPLASWCTRYSRPKIGGRWGQLVAYQAECGGGRYLFVANIDNGNLYFVDAVGGGDVGFDIQLDRMAYVDGADVIHLIRFDELSM